MTERNVSLGCLQWLDYVQNNFDELIDRSGKRVTIKTGWNGLGNVEKVPLIMFMLKIWTST